MATRITRGSLVMIVLLCAGLWLAGHAWAGHDQGQGKSQHPEGNVSFAPEPSSLLLFVAGGALIAYRCRKNKK